MSGGGCAGRDVGVRGVGDHVGGWGWREDPGHPNSPAYRQQFVRAAVDVLQDADRRRAMGAAGVLHVAGGPFGWLDVAEQWRRLEWGAFAGRYEPVIKQLGDGSLAKRRLPDEVSGSDRAGRAGWRAGAGRAYRATR